MADTPFPTLKLRVRPGTSIIEHEPDFRAFLRSVTGCGSAPPLASGVLSAWDCIRVAHGALTDREALDLACHVADHLRQEWPSLFRLRRWGDR